MSKSSQLVTFQLVNFQRSLGRSRSSVTIVSMHVELVTIIHLSQIDSGALTIHVTIVSMPLQLVTPCRFELQRLVTYVTIVSSNITTVSRHSAGFLGII